MTTRTTSHLSITPRDRALLWLHWHGRAALAIAVTSIIGLALGAALYRAVRTPAQAAQAIPTPALVLVYPTPAPTPAAVVQVMRYVVAFDQPNGIALGPIPQPPLGAVVARWGSEWVMVPWEAGQVWLRSADVGLPDVADMQPAPAPVVVERPIYIANQPVNQPAPAVATPTDQQYQTASAPQPEPHWLPVGEVRKEDFQDPDPKAACAFVGCLR